MPRFWRGLLGPRVTTSPQVISGATSPGQQCWIGSLPRSTSAPSHTTSWHGSEETTLGDMESTCFNIGHFSQASFSPLGGSGSFRNASSLPTSRNAWVLSSPIPNATRRGVPNRLARTGMLCPAGFSNSNAGPCARSTRSHISVISRCGETGAETRLSSPSFSSCAMKSRRFLYFIAPPHRRGVWQYALLTEALVCHEGRIAIRPYGQILFRIKTRLAFRPGLEALVQPEILLRHFQNALFDEFVHAARIGYVVPARIIFPCRVKGQHIALAPATCA